MSINREQKIIYNKTAFHIYYIFLPGAAYELVEIVVAIKNLTSYETFLYKYFFYEHETDKTIKKKNERNAKNNTQKKNC